MEREKNEIELNCVITQIVHKMSFAKVQPYFIFIASIQFMLVENDAVAIKKTILNTLFCASIQH